MAKKTVRRSAPPAVVQSPVLAKVVSQLKGKPATPEDVAAMTQQRQRSDTKVKEKIKMQKERAGVANPKAKKFLELAMERWQLSAEAEREVRKESLEDLKFSIGEQWDGQVMSQRNLDRRPCLTINRLPQFIRQVTNEQRQQRPAIQINPAGGGALVDTAQILQGVCRHIEINSDAEVAYDTGSDFAVRIGFGYWLVERKYLTGSFNLDIKISRIKNPFCVYFDPNTAEHDYSDAQWAFMIQDVPRREFSKDNAEALAGSLSNLATIGDRAPEWATKDTVRVANYFYLEPEIRTLAFMPDGTIIDIKNVPPGIKPLQTREEEVPRLKLARITALDILEGNKDRTAGADQDGRYIPIVPVLGDDFDVNGKRHLAGLIRYARDPQRMYNYWISAMTETIALAPRAPFIGVVGQFRSKEEMWRQANVRNFAFLEYDNVAVNGVPIPAPQRNVVEPPIQAMGAMVKQADSDLKGTTGIYDATLGQRGVEESGKAVLARKAQGDVSTLNFSDNLARSIRHTGRIILDLIPSTYDRARLQRIVSPEQVTSYVGIYNSQNAPEGTTAESVLSDLKQQHPDIALEKVYDVGVGDFDVSVSVGPSHQSKRQEAVTSMINLVGSYPQLMNIAGDLLLANMDWPGAQEIAKRLKKMLPPQVIDVNNADPETKLIAMQAQMQGMMQQHDLLVKALNDATETIKMKKLENDSREKIEYIRAQVQLLTAEAKVQGQATLATLDAQLQSIREAAAILQSKEDADGAVGNTASLSAPSPVPQAPPQIS